MKFSLKQLAVFEAICETGSVSLAAEKLSLTQSATSMSLAQLEKVLGRPLFERHGKRLSLTYWGMWLRPRVKQLLQDAKHIELGFLDQQLVSGLLRVCASQTPAEHLMPELIASLDTKFPELRLDFVVQSTHGVINDLLNFQCDLGVVEGRCDDQRLMQTEWCKDNLVIVSSPSHPFAFESEVTFSMLESAQWVLREPGSGTRAVFDSAIYPHIRHLNVWREYDFVPVIKSVVNNSLSISCLPWLEVKDSVNAGQLAVLNTPELNIERTLSFIWRADSKDNPLIDCVKREGLAMMQGRSLIK
ncbi:LysR substrate-binding domain-containing protein [Vibrio sp.]|nr:LysR substrate-binding domain-containing protein [Vibrio sp.]